jgi:hypothetical protein
LLIVNTPVTICHPVVARDEPGNVGNGETGEVMTVSEQWSKFDSGQPDLEPDATDESSANGVSPDYAVGVAEPLGEEATATDGELTEDATATDDDPTEEATATSGELTDDAPPATQLSDDASASETDLPPAEVADDGSAFLAELVRTMQATAGLERIRIAEAIERRRQERVDQVQARKASEADRMRVLAAEDMAAIEAWVDGETTRIKLERERRETAVREDLDTSLAEHASKIDREIEAIETAIATHRAEVEAYFEGLDRETDPILIAQKATKRPVFPAIEVSGDAVVATDEPVVVGVMDPEAPAETVESWAASAETSPTSEPVGSSDDVDQEGTAPESEEGVPAGMSPSIGGPGAILQSVPARRPMSWLRRNED